VAVDGGRFGLGLARVDPGGNPVFPRRRFLSGADWRQLRWYTPAGSIVTGEQWAGPDARAVAIYLEGQDAPDRVADGTLLVDDDFLVLVNGWWEPLDFVVPQSPEPQVWQAEIDTFDPEAERCKLTAGDRVRVGPRSVLVLRGPIARSTRRNGHADGHARHHIRKRAHTDLDHGRCSFRGGPAVSQDLAFCSSATGKPRSWPGTRTERTRSAGRSHSSSLTTATRSYADG
jgi:hypothetical protein